MRSKRIKTPLFKDPLASSKLEMIKNIRAKRAAVETNETEAVERARFVARSLSAAFCCALIPRNEVRQVSKLSCYATLIANKKLSSAGY